MTEEERKAKKCQEQQNTCIKEADRGTNKKKKSDGDEKSIYGGGGRAMTEKNVYKKHI